MKRALTLLFALLFAAQALAFPLVHRRKDTSTVIEGIPAIGVADGKITNNGCDGATLTCQCGAMGDSLALGACNGGTTIAEDVATGVYNLTVNSADLDNEKCIIKVVCSAGYIDQVITIYTAEYSSYEDITSMTANKAAVAYNGNGTAPAGVLKGGSSDGDGLVLLGDATAAPAGTASGLVALAGTNGAGINSRGAGTGSGLASTGAGTGSGALLTSGSGATGNALTLTAASTSGHGLASTGTGGGSGASFTGGATGSGIIASTNNSTGFAIYALNTGGTAFRSLSNGGNGRGIFVSGNGTGAGMLIDAGATGVGVLVSSTAADVLQLTAAGGNSDAIQLTGQGTGWAVNMVSGNGQTGSLDRLLERRDSTL